MSRIPQGKVLVKAGKFEGGKLPYLNYVGQIKPADMAKIIWWGAFGSDTTGDGTVGNPYLTFDRALQAFSSLAHKWILKTDLSVYGEAGPGPYIDDPSDRVYLDPTRADDSGDGLTAATAKKTYGAAKTALGSSGRSVIHCLGSFTMTDVMDAPTQGEIGATLTLEPSATAINSRTDITSLNQGAGSTIRGIKAYGNTVIAVLTGTGGVVSFYRSTDSGKTFALVPATTTDFRLSIGTVYNVATNGAGVWVVVGESISAAKTIFYSTDNGATWTRDATVDAQLYSVAWSGTHFVAIGFNRTTPTNSEIWRSTNGTSWTSATSAWGANTFTRIHIASDSNGNVAAIGTIAAVTPFYQTSSDHGATWVNRSALFTGRRCTFIAFAGGRWCMYSNDGTTSTPMKLHFSTAFTTTWTERAGVFSGTASAYQNAQDISYSDRLGAWLIHKYAASPLNRIIIAVTDLAITTLYDSVDLPYIQGGWQTLIDDAYLIVSGNDFSASRALSYDMLGNIFSNVTNAEFSEDRNMCAGGSAALAFIRSRPDMGMALLSRGANVLSCVLAAVGATAIRHEGENWTIKRSIVTSDVLGVHCTGTAATQDAIAITQNTIIGGLTLNNAGGTDKELIQDNIIEGNFTAAAAVTVRSNIRGAVVNASGLSKISTINPIFVDTVDFELSRVALGQSIDSPLVKLSAAYSYTYNTQAYKDDLGPRRAFIALVQTSYKRAFLLPKFSGNALSEDIENVASLLKSINGVPDVSNQPQGRLEIISWVSKSVDSQVREFISYLERERNTQCELYYDFDESALDDIVVDGAHSSGTFEVNIQPKDVPVGAVLTLFGQIRYVVQRYPRSGEATKLILDDVLAGGLSDAQTITIEQVQGAGTYVFIPEQRRQNLRVFSRRRDTYTGMKYTFARKAL